MSTDRQRVYARKLDPCYIFAYRSSTRAFYLEAQKAVIKGVQVGEGTSKNAFNSYLYIILDNVYTVVHWNPPIFTTNIFTCNPDEEST